MSQSRQLNASKSTGALKRAATPGPPKSPELGPPPLKRACSSLILKTPQKQSSFALPASFSKRASEFHQKLGHKKNPVMRASVAAQQFLRIMKSPTTKSVLPSVVAAHSPFKQALEEMSRVTTKVDANVQTKLNYELRMLIRSKCQKKYDVVTKIKARWLREHASLRKVSRMVGMPHNSLLWYFKFPKGQNRKISATQSKIVLEFFKREDISMVLPHKRYAKLIFLRSTFHEQYGKYVKHEQNAGRVPLSKSSVHRVLPKKRFRTVGKIPFLTCCCTVCTNFDLALQSSARVGLKGLSRSLTQNAVTSCCVENPPREHTRDIYACPQLCRTRTCKQCTQRYSRMLAHANRFVDLSQPVEYWQWGNRYKVNQQGKRVKAEFKRNLHSGTYADLIGVLKLQVHTLPQHLFWYTWQAEQLEFLKKILDPGEVIFIVDFAKNITVERQNEASHGFFHRQSITLHPVIMYYLCPQQCGKMVHDEFMCISPDCVHDAHAVHAYTLKAVEHLSGQGTVVNKMYIFSDNCGSQYKSKLPFELLSTFGIPAEHHYFGAGHGKSAADGFVGRLKMWLDRQIRSMKRTVQDAIDLWVMAENEASSKVRITKAGTDCVHHQKTHVYIGEIDRTYRGEAVTLKGTRKLHSIKTTGVPGVLLCRDTSCFCRYKPC
jgi:hypothetical protein